MVYRVVPDEIADLPSALVGEAEYASEDASDAQSWAEENSMDYHYGLAVIDEAGQRL